MRPKVRKGAQAATQADETVVYHTRHLRRAHHRRLKQVALDLEVTVEEAVTRVLEAGLPLVEQTCRRHERG